MITRDPHPHPNTLREFLLGKLAEPECHTVEDHLTVCADCQALSATAADGSADSLIGLLRTADQKIVAGAGAATTPSCAVTHVWDGVQPSSATSVPPDLREHTRYRVLRLLGSGGMGAVWLAEHTVLRKNVALKVIRAEFLATTAAVVRFRREVEAVARLSHPNIVAAFDAERAGDTHFLVMEYVEGQTLADHLKAGPLPVLEACRTARDAARGLAHAHAAGLVHRDVKPGNLIRSAEGTTKLLDFGLVAATDDDFELTGANVVMGTPDYIAPEQAEDPRAADARSDVYALGCTLYHLLSGQVPYPVPSSLRKLDAHRTEVLPSVPDLPAGLNAVLARMTAKKPADRFSSAAEVADALEPYCTTCVEPQKPRKRYRIRVAVAVGLLMLIAGLAAAGNNWVIIRDKDGKEVARVKVPEGGKVELLPTLPTPPTDPPAPAASDAIAPTLTIPYTVGLRFNNIDLSRDGSRVAATRGVETARVYDTVTGKQSSELEDTQFVTFTADDKYILGLKDPMIRVLDAKTGKHLRTVDARGHVWAIRALPGGSRVLAVVEILRGVVLYRVFDMETGEKIAEVPWSGGDVILFFANGTRALVQKRGRAPITVLDTAGKPLDEYAHLRDLPRARSISPDEKWLVCDAANGFTVHEMATGKLVHTLDSGPDTWGGYIGVERLLTTLRDPSELGVWHLPTGRLMARLRAPTQFLEGWWDARFSLDGTTVVLAAGTKIYVWRLANVEGGTAPK